MLAEIYEFYAEGPLTPHWHDLEIEELGREAERRWRAAEYVDEQIRWWQEQGIPAYEACEAVYGKSPAHIRWDQLRDRLIRGCL